jgi:chloramphenicol 3-O phosphotransferase
VNNEQLLILNGASSSGKTILCKKLQEILDEPYVHLEEDCFVFNTYHHRFLTGETAAPIFTKTMLGYYRSLKAFLSAGHNVLADTGFYTPDLLAKCVQELASDRVWIIGVHCSVTELERRELERADRQRGLAKEQYATIHNGVIYDIEVDTTQRTVEECAQTIKERLSALAAPSAITLLRDKLNAEG